MQSAAVTDTKSPITIATVVQLMLKNKSTTVPSGKGVVFGKASILARQRFDWDQ
jgi:hypothetical protein